MTTATSPAEIHAELEEAERALGAAVLDGVGVEEAETRIEGLKAELKRREVSATERDRRNQDRSSIKSEILVLEEKEAYYGSAAEVLRATLEVHRTHIEAEQSRNALEEALSSSHRALKLARSSRRQDMAYLDSLDLDPDVSGRARELWARRTKTDYRVLRPSGDYFEQFPELIKRAESLAKETRTEIKALEKDLKACPR